MRKVPRLRRISSDSFEFPADDSDFLRKGRNVADNTRQAAEKRDLQVSSVGIFDGIERDFDRVNR